MHGVRARRAVGHDLKRPRSRQVFGGHEDDGRQRVSPGPVPVSGERGAPRVSAGAVAVDEVEFSLTGPVGEQPVQKGGEARLQGVAGHGGDEDVAVQVRRAAALPLGRGARSCVELRQVLPKPLRQAGCLVASARVARRLQPGLLLVGGEEARKLSHARRRRPARRREDGGRDDGGAVCDESGERDFGAELDLSSNQFVAKGVQDDYEQDGKGEQEERTPGAAPSWQRIAGARHL